MRGQPSAATLFVVACGGAIGALARWLLGEWVPDGPGLPVTTMAINVVGSGALALLPAVAWVRRSSLAPAFIGTGMLGGFTTMSAYAVQAHELLADGAYGTAAGYLVGTVGMAVLGAAAAEHLVVGRLATPEDEAAIEARDGDR